MRQSVAPLRGLVPLLVALASGARRPAAGLQSSVGRLLVDIDQSVRSTQSDAEMVFASLFSYDNQLDQSLVREVRGMNETLERLSSVRRAYLSDIEAARTVLQQFSVTAHRSEQNASLFQATVAETDKRFKSLSALSMQLMQVLRSAEATPEGALLTPDAPEALADPTKIYAAVGRVLAADRGLAAQFPEVYAALGQETQTAGVPFVRMTPSLLKRTFAALSAIQTRLGSQKERALLELKGQGRGLAVEAAAAEATEAQQRGLWAEKEHAVEELGFSVRFTEAVLRMDNDLRAKVGSSMKSKAELVERIRLSRRSQLKTLKELLGMMGNKQLVDEQDSPPSLSFLEVKTRKEDPKDSLLFEIETALHRKADTHGILLRIKGMLDESAVDAPSAVSVVKELGSVLQTLDKDEARANAARQRCEAQQSHTVHEKQDIKDNLAVMSVVQQHMRSASAAAKSNLKRIAAKAQALQTSAKTFSKVVSRAMKMLRGHSNDRATMVAAVERASGVVRQARGVKSRPVALLAQMRHELQAQERWERSYRAEEASLNTAFLAYIRNYLELLRERRAHYERSLSSLELYSSEVEGDVAAQSGAMETSGGLERESRELCARVLAFYESFHRRRLRLVDGLRELLPKLPELGGARQ